MKKRPVSKCVNLAGNDNDVNGLLYWHGIIIRVKLGGNDDAKISSWNRESNVSPRVWTNDDDDTDDVDDVSEDDVDVDVNVDWLKTLSKHCKLKWKYFTRRIQWDGIFET